MQRGRTCKTKFDHVTFSSSIGGFSSLLPSRFIPLSINIIWRLDKGCRVTRLEALGWKRYEGNQICNLEPLESAKPVIRGIDGLKVTKTKSEKAEKQKIWKILSVPSIELEK